MRKARDPTTNSAVVAKSGTTTTTTGPLTVTFTNLTAAQANGSPLTTPKYTVTCTATGGVTKTVTALASPVTVAGATTAKNYTCSVKAHNVRGYGLTSAPALPVIVGSPTQVAKPTISDPVVGTMHVVFTVLTAAQANGSPLTVPQYTATCTPSTGGVTKSATGTTSPLNVAGLSVGHNYTCTVKAHNARGYGLTSPASLVHVA